MYPRRIPLSLIILLLLTISVCNCKKNPITSDPESLTRPVIWLNLFEMAFVAAETGPNPPSQVLRIKNAGQGTLKYAVTADADWLNVEPAGGSSSGQTNEHAVNVNKNGLAAQDNNYTATITVTSSEAYNNPQKLKVSLKITKEPPPEISVTPQALSFAAQVGGSNPSPQTMTIRNSGQSTLNYTITDNAAWLEVNPASGTSIGENKTHTVSINSGGLAEGSYAGTITITDPNATNSPKQVSVTLQISKQLPPTIWVNKQSLSFSSQQGGSNPSPQSIGIKNVGGGTLSYAVTWDASWLSVSPSSGSSSGQENSHTVSVNSSGLGQGTYNSMITITSRNAANSPQQVSVTLQVTAIPTNNEIRVSCSPSEGPTGTTVNVAISILGNINEITSFGLQLSFDTNMFQYIGTIKGSLTETWSYVDGNNVSGTVTIGGLTGSGSPISKGSSGTIAVVTLKVTGGSYSNGQQSQITIRSYADDIAGMKPEPASATFTYRK